MLFPLQDMLVPLEDLSQSLEFFHSKVQVYPIWICPFKLPNKPGMLKVTGEAEEQM